MHTSLSLFDFLEISLSNENMFFVCCSWCAPWFVFVFGLRNFRQICTFILRSHHTQGWWNTSCKSLLLLRGPQAKKYMLDADAMAKGPSDVSILLIDEHIIGSLKTIYYMAPPFLAGGTLFRADCHLNYHVPRGWDLKLPPGDASQTSSFLETETWIEGIAATAHVPTMVLKRFSRKPWFQPGGWELLGQSCSSRRSTLDEQSFLFIDVKIIRRLTLKLVDVGVSLGGIGGRKHM